MRVEKTLWVMAVVCAVLLLFAPFTPRTSWSHRGGGMRHSAGWDWIAPLAGVVAIASLAVGAHARPRIAGPVFAASFAAIAFGGATIAAAGHWGSIIIGALEIEGWHLYPAPSVSFFAVIASAGTVVTLILLGTWLRQGQDEW
jgi:hypothetical protein